VPDVIVVYRHRLNRDYARQIMGIDAVDAKYGHQKGTCNGSTSQRHDIYSFFLIRPYFKLIKKELLNCK